MIFICHLRATCILDDMRSRRDIRPVSWTQWIIPRNINYLSYSYIFQWKIRCVLYCIRYSYFYLLMRIRENKFNPIKIYILLVKVSSNSDEVELVFSDSRLKIRICKSNSIEITSSFWLSDIRVTKIIHIPWDNSLRPETLIVCHVSDVYHLVYMAWIWHKYQCIKKTFENICPLNFRSS